MSLYIGKDNNGSNIVGISKTTESSDSLKSPTSLSNVAFHSKYPMMGVYSDSVCGTTTISSNSAYNNTWVRKRIDIPSNVLSAILNDGDRRVVLFYRTGSPNPITVYNPAEYPNITDTIDVLNYTGGKYYITTTNTVSTIRVVVLEYSVTGNYTGSVLFGSPVSISGNSFFINDEDYFRKKFLVTPSVNNVDSSILINGVYFQVINSTPSTGGLVFTSSSSNTTVSFGGKTILSSSGNYKQLFGHPLVPATTKVFTIPTGFDAVSTIATGFPVGAEILSLSFTANDLYPNAVVNVLISSSNSSWIPVLLGFFPTMPDGQPGNYITYLRLLNGVLQSKSEVSAMGGDSVAGSVGVINGFVTYAAVSG